MQLHRKRDHAYRAPSKGDNRARQRRYKLPASYQVQESCGYNGVVSVVGLPVQGRISQQDDSEVPPTLLHCITSQKSCLVFKDRKNVKEFLIALLQTGGSQERHDLLQAAVSLQPRS